MEAHPGPVYPVGPDTVSIQSFNLSFFNQGVFMIRPSVLTKTLLAAVVVLMTFFPMLVSTLAGLQATQRIERELMHIYAAS